ncbi:MAG: alanine:cation symporter family protein [Cyclobacteriaceae bacterium]|nr:alanine:cation symporter family protein [Cyclobacteriaceae bacterium]MCH8515147.1 alanine:cation symporter family protein [Cyclobacteriaceae bacterium]
MWGIPLLILLVGGGIYLTFFSGFIQFAYIRHAINILRGKHDEPGSKGEINHFEALSGAIAATVGMGNISGVAIAITMGGPGALVWMWISAILGMSIKFFTCSLAIMYRGYDSAGKLQGGPMYVIREGLGKKWMPLAIFFCIAGMLGPLPTFQANQLTDVIRVNLLEMPDTLVVNLSIGLVIMAIIAVVILGGIKRIGKVAASVVPLMVVIYLIAVLIILFNNRAEVPAMFSLIFNDAFRADSVLGGAVGSLIIIGAKRAAFSNEAGIGTAPMIHGASTTNEPTKEGLVAMLGPAIDTILVCTLTALAILSTGAWKSGSQDGILLTMQAFEIGLSWVGKYILILCVVFFSLSSLFTFSYYGTKCLGFMIGADKAHYFNYFYLVNVIIGAVASLDAVIGLIDGMYALMAIPTMVSTLLLAPKVKAEAKRYFKKIATQR